MKRLLILCLFFISGCCVHNIEKISYDENSKPTEKVSYWSGSFLADMTKTKGYGKADDNSIELSFGEVKSSYDPNNIKSLSEGIAAGVVKGLVKQNDKVVIWKNI